MALHTVHLMRDGPWLLDPVEKCQCPGRAGAIAPALSVEDVSLPPRPRSRGLPTATLTWLFSRASLPSERRPSSSPWTCHARSSGSASHLQRRVVASVVLWRVASAMSEYPATRTASLDRHPLADIGRPDIDVPTLAFREQRPVPFRARWCDRRDRTTLCTIDVPLALTRRARGVSRGHTVPSSRR
jgi:hypothetical protein